LDTAVDPQLNIHDSKLWAFLVEIARAGRILGFLQGPPCETWTSARHSEQRDEEGNLIRGPRPLRSASELWGLPLLSGRELAQVFTGNCLLLKGLLLAVIIAMHGGVTILEHPAVPFDETYASIWRLGVIKLLLRQPLALFRKVTVEQWRFGSGGIKPTTLMYSNTDLPRALRACELPDVPKPKQYLIGKNLDGSYKTAVAKEYPAALNQGFALALQRILDVKLPYSTDAASIEPFGYQLAMIASSTECGEIKPDYQPNAGR